MDLDAPEDLNAIDSLGMFAAVESFPSQIVASAQMASDVITRLERKAFTNLVGCGMGGSAIGIELIRSWLQKELTTPLALIRDYSLPRYVSDKDLVFLASYSGDTEETLSCLVEAVKRGSAMFSVSSGGKMEEFSKILNVPHVKIPSGYQPRAALGFLFTPLLTLLVHLGVVTSRPLDELIGSVEALTSVAERCSCTTPTAENPSKQLAVKIFGSLPIVYGYGAFAAAALRFKQQLNENSKLFSKYEVFPELDHNDIEGFEINTLEMKPVLVLLRGDDDNPQVRNRVDETLNVLRTSVADIVEVRGIGSGITQLLTTIQICDSASLFLACLRGIDPGPVNQIAKLKGTLSSKTALIESLTAEVNQLSGRIRT